MGKGNICDVAAVDTETGRRTYSVDEFRQLALRAPPFKVFYCAQCGVRLKPANVYRADGKLDGHFKVVSKNEDHDDCDYLKRPHSQGVRLPRLTESKPLSFPKKYVEPDDSAHRSSLNSSEPTIAREGMTPANSGTLQAAAAVHSRIMRQYPLKGLPRAQKKMRREERNDVLRSHPFQLLSKKLD